MQTKEKIEKRNIIDPIILSFDTSCDDTSCAVLKGRRILSNVVSSQVEIHKKWGGVVPMVAKLTHLENIEPVFKEAMKRARVKIEDINYIACTQGPGLAIALEVGLSFAKKLAVEIHKPFIPINHMEGHLFSSLSLNSKGNGNLSDEEIELLFPILGILVSGKNTELIYVKNFQDYLQIGQTLDDAAGECFDKVGRMLNLGYPGGPIISEFAKKGNKKNLKSYQLPIPLRYSKDYNFSFSGLKTACLYMVEKLRKQYKTDKEWIYDFCFSFVETIIKSIENKSERALQKYPELNSIIIGGGVINNEKICIRLGRLAKKYNKKFFIPDIKLRSDNGAMIGIAAYFKIQSGLYIEDPKEIEKVDRDPTIEF